MNYIKVNYRHNLIKLIVLRALDLRRGWYDNREICPTHRTEVLYNPHPHRLLGRNHA